MCRRGAQLNAYSVWSGFGFDFRLGCYARTRTVRQVSFHKFGEFFPGTGALDDIGYGKGKGYTVNVPLKDGMDDDSYRMLYEPIMQKVRHAGVRRRWCRPQAIEQPRVCASWQAADLTFAHCSNAHCQPPAHLLRPYLGPSPDRPRPASLACLPPLPPLQVMELYQPGAIVMCCGADSLSGDRLGCFNLSLEGHSHCLEFLAK